MFRFKILLHGNELEEFAPEIGREYIFGRGSSADIQLSEHSGISRSHFKLVEENGQWTVQVLAKFSGISHAGLPVQHLVLTPGTAFKLGPYDFQFVELLQEEAAPVSQTLPVTFDHHAMENSQSVAKVAAGSTYQPQSEAFDGNSEATQIFTAQAEVPYVRIQSSGRGEVSHRLDGRVWIAGREDGCDIALDDRKASRRQFELSSTPQGYFIRDLGSSNGTSLNGLSLASDELKPIRSGDVIQVGSCLVTFEIRDPNFERKLMVVPPEVRSEVPVIEQNPYAMINYPVPMSGGGAVMMRPPDRPGILAKFEDLLPFNSQSPEEKRKKTRIWLAAIAVVILLVGFFSMNSPDKPAKQSAKTNIAFDKLSPKDQQNVKELYAVAYNLYMQQKLALAAEQLGKLHHLIPEGYENSQAMATECAQQSELERQLRELEDQKRRQEEIRRTVEKTIADCDPLSRRSNSVDEITHCLEGALSLDPENPRIHEQIGRVQQRLDQARISEQQRKDYQGQVARGKALFDKAFNLEVAGEFLDALEAYRKHISSSYPDPQGLKSQSAKKSLEIQKRMSSRVEESVKAAEAAYAVGNFREALDDLKSAKKIDPRNEHVAELLGKYRRELDLKMREIYEDSIISEGLGKVDEPNGAKFLWKKILDTDHPEGEYYKKAKNKMKTYGS